MTALLKYDAACRAIAEAKAVDDVKGIRDQAEALRHYARQARNREAEISMAEIRFRAERRIGEIKLELRASGRLHEGGRPLKTKDKTTSDAASEVSKVRLADLDINDRMSQRCEAFAGYEPNAFERLVARWRAHQEKEAERVSLNLLREGDKKAARIEREKRLGAKLAALPDKRYGVIYADPEWRFEVYSRNTGMDRAADNHYPTSATDAICERPVGTIAANDCVLFLWATVPMLPDALKVMAAWGFAYKSHCIWTKDKVGTGYWFRNAHELLLVGTRGNVPAPAMGTQWASTVEGRVGKHSAKPERFYELIEQYFPTLPKIELNARNSRPGWDAWGLEAPTDAAGEPLAHDADGVIVPVQPVESDVHV